MPRSSPDHPKDLSAEDKATPTQPGPAKAGRGDVIVATITALIAAFMLYLAFDFSVEARRLPIVVGIPFVAISLLNLGSVIISASRTGRGSKGRSTDVSQEATGDPSVEEASSNPEDPQASSTTDDAQDQSGMPFLPIAASVLLLVGLFVSFGLLVSTLIFTPLFMLWSGRQPWWKIGLVTIGLILTFMALAHFFGLRLYSGMFSLNLGGSAAGMVPHV